MKTIKVGIVAGEQSGDILGGELITSLRQIYPQAEFRGIGGDSMISAGLDSLFSIDRLSVMGLVEPLKRLPELLRIRKTLYQTFIQWPADIVIGIDSPDFNLDLELKLKRQGVKTIHYVSPSVWAWRRGRIKKIAQAVDHMLTLFPFENDFYREHNIPVTFVGHPLADSIPMESDKLGVRQQLGISAHKLLAVMPGSRSSEIKQMCTLFIDTARRLFQHHPEMQFIIPAANAERYKEIELLLADSNDLPITLVQGESQAVMAASDAVLLTSGTTALEAMLLKKPMVVAYRMGSASYWLLSRMVKTPYIALPNLIAGKQLVPELIQDDANIENLLERCEAVLFDDDLRAALCAEFGQLHQQLRLNASQTAAATIAGVLENNRNYG